MKFNIIILSIFCLHGCAALPDIYLIDRHTVMEEEASGEWPQLEERFIQQGLNKGATNFPGIEKDPRRERAFHVLNGEFTQDVRQR